ncbi:MAG: hypothetical protein RIS70_1961 [Planctomycetota bacterium]|jgi:hypothetical protein
MQPLLPIPKAKPAAARIVSRLLGVLVFACIGWLSSADTTYAGCGEYGFSWQDSRSPRIVETYARLARLPESMQRDWLHGETTMPIRLPCTSPECRGSIPSPTAPSPVLSWSTDFLGAILIDGDDPLPLLVTRHRCETPRLASELFGSRLERPPRWSR